MFLQRTLLLSSIVCIAAGLSACAGKPQFRNSCASESDTAWSELSIAKAKGFGGTISYTKAFSMLTAARTMQAVGNFDSCYRNAKDAREYIRNSLQGK